MLPTEHALFEIVWEFNSSSATFIDLMSVHRKIRFECAGEICYQQTVILIYTSRNAFKHSCNDCILPVNAIMSAVTGLPTLCCLGCRC